MIRVTLPCSNGAIVEREQKATVARLDRRRTPKDAEADSAQLRALVIEDDPSYRAFVVALTERLGFAADEAADGGHALEKLAQAAYDVAIIDQQMPRVTGLDVITHIRADPSTRTLYAMMLTAREDVETKLTALEAGFDDFLTKGASEPEISAKLVAARRIAARQRTLDGRIRELYGLATRDELTGVFNRRFLLSEADRLAAEGGPLSLILFDLDAFKHVNDTYGHLAGDSVLRDVGALFLRNTRPEDLICRYGGDEFVMLISDLGLKEVERIAKRLQRDVRELRWTAGEETFAITVTTGIATSHLLPKPAISHLLNAADGDLYKNKWLRNRGKPISRNGSSDAKGLSSRSAANNREGSISRG